MDRRLREGEGGGGGELFKGIRDDIKEDLLALSHLVIASFIHVNQTLLVTGARSEGTKLKDVSNNNNRTSEASPKEVRDEQSSLPSFFPPSLTPT